MALLFGGFFVVVMSLVLGAGYFVLRLGPVSDGGPDDSPDLGGLGMAPQPMVTQALHSLGESVPIRGKKADVLRGRLFRAGFRDPSFVTVFQGCRAAISAGAGLFGLWFSSGTDGGLLTSLLGCIGMAGVASLVPDHWLHWRVRLRAARIRSALPPALELITLAVEAGQSLDSAIQNAAASLRRVHPDLCDELSFYLLETRAGTGRLQALAHLAERSPEPELKKVVTVISDTERFGGSPGSALRAHGKYLRSQMRFRAQASARKLSVKLVFPVFFLIFPSVLLVTLGPAYLQIRLFFQSLME